MKSDAELLGQQPGPDRVAELDRARSAIAAASEVVVLSGAGISTDSGIPDFRGPDGLWTREPHAPRLGNPADYLADAELRRRGWARRLEAPVWSARPNRGHLALRRLEELGRLSLLVTQNADGLHQEAGHDPGRVIEVHGSVRRTRCLSCGASVPTASVLERVRAGSEDPRCEVEVEGVCCGGILKVATVGFGEPVDLEQLARAVQATTTCEVFLAVGTTLLVDPVAGLVPLAKDCGATVVIVNGGPTRHDALADVRLDGSISDVLPALVESRGG